MQLSVRGRTEEKTPKQMCSGVFTFSTDAQPECLPCLRHIAPYPLGDRVKRRLEGISLYVC